MAIQAGLFSAALTSFIIDKIHDLQVDPAQQMVYYQQQNVALLAQISKQVSSIALQVSIPSTPLPPYVFSLNPSDVRVNVFWFMSLVFSISAALLATLVQQWVRDYMHVFQRYSHPLKSTRLRQYLYEGVEGWYMPVVAESVPGLVHVSLFLFFVARTCLKDKYSWQWKRMMNAKVATFGQSNGSFIIGQRTMRWNHLY